jgi:hypothetical protein
VGAHYVGPHSGDDLPSPAQSGGRMKGGDQDGVAAEAVAPASQPADALIGSEQGPGGEVAKRQHHSRVDQLDLLIQEGAAGGDLLGEGVPVARGPTLDDVGDVDLPAGQSRFFFQELVQKLTGSPHEGPTLQVLVAAGSFPDDHESGMRITLAEDDRGSTLGQGTEGARQGDPLDIG